MPYKNAAANSQRLKFCTCKTINVMKTGKRQTMQDQQKKDNQFFRDLKTLSLRKNSIKICLFDGFIKNPSWLIQP